jgi:hypothetical protein
MANSAFDVLNRWFEQKRADKRQDQLLSAERAFILQRERDQRAYRDDSQRAMDKVNTDYANKLSGEIEDLYEEFDQIHNRVGIEIKREAMTRIANTYKDRFKAAIGANGNVIPDAFNKILESQDDGIFQEYNDTLIRLEESGGNSELANRLRFLQRRIQNHESTFRDTVRTIQDKSGLEVSGGSPLASTVGSTEMSDRELEEGVVSSVGSAGGPSSDSDALSSVTGDGGGEKLFSYEGTPLQAIFQNVGKAASGPVGYIKDQLAPMKGAVSSVVQAANPLTGVGPLGLPAPNPVPPLVGNPPISRNNLASPETGAPELFNATAPIGGVEAIQKYAQPQPSPDELARAMAVRVLGSADPAFLDSLQAFASSRYGLTPDQSVQLMFGADKGDPEATRKLHEIRSAYGASPSPVAR